MFYIVDPEAPSVDGPFNDESEVTEEFGRRAEEDQENLLVIEISNETNIATITEIHDFVGAND